MIRSNTIVIGRQKCLVRCVFFTALISSVAHPGNALQAADEIDFSRDIQPILSENCYYCHGQDGEQRQADLRLDVRVDAMMAIEPGDAESSELVSRILSDDPDGMMPPADSNRKLTDAQKQLLQEWIDAGAEWSEHWAYRSIEKSDQDAGRAIDFFVQRKLKANQLDFSAAADRATLIRRVSIDLTGLPPTVEQLEQYLSDTSPKAYAKMVDRYLASPAYGERMAWRWLDAARYADSNGYQGDNERTMWPWRDWVVKAYNENMSFKQFSIWQLAGDLLPDATDEMILATAFNRNHPINGEGGRIPEENRVEYVMDMTETAGTVWMALTFNCCRCHDHKYDPLTQDDYYSLSAFFNQTPIDGSGGDAKTPPVLAVPAKEQTLQVQDQKRKVEETQQEMDARAKELADGQPAWEAEQLTRAGRDNGWQILKLRKAFADGATLEQQKDSSVLSTIRSAATDSYRIIGRTKLKRVTGLRVEALTHPTTRDGKLSRSSTGNFVLTEFKVLLLEPNKEPRQIEIASADASSEAEGATIAAALDDDPKSGWSVAETDLTRDQEAVFVFAQPVELTEKSQLQVVFDHQSDQHAHNLGRVRVLLTEHQSPKLLGMNFDLWRALEVATGKRNDAQAARVKSSYLGDDADYAVLSRRLNQAKKKQGQLECSIPQVMVMADMPKPRKTFLLNRGSYEERKDEVSAHVPSMLDQLPTDVKADRLALAEWLFSDSNPLTPRVAVNRLWGQFFGIGLVKTTEDFGVQGEPPSHPELLDWLSAEYRDSGWDTKHLVRLIVNSRTYKQSSKTTPELLEVDPYNRLLARSPRYRMPSWMLRDYALATSGRLVGKMGGKPVNTYQPAGVWEEASFGKKKYQRSKAEGLYRRSLYTFWRRIAAPTMFFDNADRMICSVTTYRTNTPLHALNTLNDVTFVEASRLLATKALREREDDADRLELIFKTDLLRAPKPEEQQILLAALERTRQAFSDNRESAKQFVDVGDVPFDEELDTVELASWTSLCLAVFNLDETLTRQ